jgi:hypothetical protein
MNIKQTPIVERAKLKRLAKKHSPLEGTTTIIIARFLAIIS